MANRTGIKNVSGDFIMLPSPYAGGLGANQEAVVGDDPNTVINNLGGAAFLAGNILVESLPISTPLTPHGAGTTGGGGSSPAIKLQVRAASTANVNIASAPSAIDGVSLNPGDRVLLKNQSTGSQNGPYVWNGAAAAMTRTSDFDVGVSIQSGLLIEVQEGTANGDTLWTLATANPITVGTTALTFSEGQAGAAGGDLTGNFPNPTIAALAVTSAKIAAGAVTPSKTAQLLRTQVSLGHNGAGAVTFAGTLVGDIVQAVVSLTDDSDLTASFEATISIAGQIQQSSASDLSAKTLLFLLQRQS